MVTAVATFAIAADGGAAAAAEQVAVGRFGGVNCLETAVVVPMPAERLAAFLPAGYVPASQSGLPGLGDLFIGVAECERMSVDGREVGRGAISDVGIGVESPDGSPGAHSYELWELGTSSVQQSLLRRAGIAGAVVPGLDSTDDGVLRAQAPWPEQGYSLEVTSPSPFPAGGDSNQWWHEGGRGRARLAFSFPRLAYRAGAGRVTADPGSTLAQLLGDTDATGLGFGIRFDYEAAVSAERPLATERPPRIEPRARRLRVRARPRRFPLKRRTRIRVRVTRADAEPATGAVVTLAGRRATTNDSGRALLHIRARRPGRYLLTARLEGARPARLVLRTR